MELKNHWQIIKKYRWLIIITAVAITAVSFLICWPQDAKYEATASFVIKPIHNPINPEENYYLLESSQMIGDTIMSWTITPDIVSSIFDKSNIIPAKNNINLENYFHAKRYSPQNIIIKFIASDKDSTQKLANNLIQTFNYKSTQEWNNFYIQAPEPTIIAKKPSRKIYSIIGFITGIILGLIFAHLSWYFKEK